MSQADITIISDVNQGGYDAAVALGAQHKTMVGLATRFNLLKMLIAWSALIRELRKCPAEVIWFHARLSVFLARLALVFGIWRPKAAVIITHHGLPFGRGRRSLNRVITLMVEKILLRCCPAPHIVLLTQDMAEQMKRAAGPVGLTKHRFHVLGNCSDLGEFPIQPERNNRNIIMTGRVGWQKNYDLAVRLLPHLPTDITLTLCGGGTENDQFQNAMRRRLPNEVSGRLLFAGSVDDVRPHLVNADAYMLTSRYEGMPIGALEAFEVGLPIILKDFDGAKELVGAHPCAIMDDFSNLKATAQKVTALMERCAEDRENLRQKAQDVWRENWSFDPFAQNAQALVDRITSD